MTRNQAKAIVNKIINDIHGRKGIGNEWDMIDSEIKVEIRNAWIQFLLDGA
jgi:hypothetical protein